jgi:hypothetical protein
VKVEGEAFDSFVPLLGVAQLGAAVIPEPASFLLTALGLSALGLRARAVRPTRSSR